MTAAITTVPDGLGGTWVYAGGDRLGHVFPARTTGFPRFQPVAGCRWFGRRDHTDAVPFPTPSEAYAHVCAGQDSR